MESGVLKVTNFYDKKAYTHGFENIYSLEKVDVKSIRKVAVCIDESQVKRERLHVKKELIPPDDDQYKFSFIEKEGVIKNFKLEEPLEVLQLSIQTAKRFQESGSKTLKDLLMLKNQGFTSVKALGQGHIDEVNQKLQNYLTISHENSLYIDFESILKCLLSSLDNKQRCALLTAYQLQDIYSFTPQEKLAAKAWIMLKKEELFHGVQEALLKECSQDFIQEVFEKVFIAFIKPWVLKRHFLVSLDELEERIWKKSLNEQVGIKAYKLLKDLFYPSSTPFDSYLACLEPNLFVLNNKKKEWFLGLKKVITSYFYHLSTSYSLDALIEFVVQDQAKYWQGVDRESVRKLILKSASFLVVRGECSEVKVKLNWVEYILKSPEN